MAVAAAIVDAMNRLRLAFPSLDAAKVRELKEARKTLMAEK
jgi:hypothetical protein